MITRIGKYEIKAKLGEGGFGTVYRGFDPRVGWDVAIKVLSEKADADTLRRFPDEAGLTGKLRHRNIVTVHDYGEEDGSPYLVMELLEGQNLHDIIAGQHPLSIMQKVQIMLQVAEGLYYAHQNGVVHRDIKPANIMVAPDLTVKIMDFGIARITGRGTRQTRQGDLIGSFLYMAPELFANLDADPQTDIFSYGDTFYELLTGRHPFYAETLAAAVSQIQGMDPIPIHELFAQCPPRLEAIVDRTLKKDRDLRYQNLNDVIFGLRPILIDLRQARASMALDDVRRQVDAKQWKEADRLVKLVLDMDQANREAWQLHETIQDELRKEDIRKHLEKLLKEAEQLILQQKFDEAISRLEAAYQQDQANPAILHRIDEVKAYREAKRRAGKLVSEARAMVPNDLNGSLEKVNQALQIFPPHLDAQSFKQELLPKLQARREQALLDQAKAIRDQGDFEKAIALLSSDECQTLNSSRIADYRTRLENEWSTERQKRRKQEFDSRLQAAEKLLGQQNLPALEDMLQDMRSQFPEHVAASIRFTMLRDALAGRRQTERVEAIRQNVESLSKARQFDAAREALRVGQATFPEDPVLKSLPQRIFDAEWDHARGQKIADVKEKVHQLLKSGKLREALLTLDSPESHALQDSGLKQWREQLARQEYEDGLRAARDQGQQLLDRGDYPRALEVLKEHAQRYSEDPALQVLLHQAQRGVDSDDERRVVNATLSRTSELRGARQWREALKVAEDAAKRFPKNATLKLLVKDLQSEVLEHEQLETVIKLRQQIEDLIQQKNFASARLALESARRRFPDEPQFDVVAKSLERAESVAELSALCGQVDRLLAEDKIPAASELLASVRNRFARETMFQFWQRELEKKQQYVGALIEARNLLAAKQYDRAEQILKEAIPNASDPRAVTLLNQVIAERDKKDDRQRQQEDIRRKREEVQRIVDLAAGFNLQENYAESVRVLTEGLSQHPDEEPLKLLLRETQRKLALQEGLQQCESLRRNRQWQPALDLVAKLLAEHRNRGDLLDLQTQIRREKDAQDKETAIHGALDRAGQHLTFEQPALAVDVLQAAIRDLGADSRLSAMLQQAAQDREKQDRYRQQVAEEDAAIKDRIKRKDWSWLRGKVPEVTVRYSNEPIFQDLPAEVLRAEREDFLQKVNEGYRLLNDGRVQDAEDFVSGEIGAFSGEPEVLALKKAIAGEKQRLANAKVELEQRAAHVAEGLRAAQACENKGDFAGALRALEPYLQRYRDDAQLIAARERLEEKTSASDRTQVVDGIRRALNATQWPQALELIDRARGKYPNDPELVSLEDKALDQRRTFLESAESSIRAKLDSRKIEDAQTLFNQNLARYPDQSSVRAVAKDIEAARIRWEFVSENLQQAAQSEQQADFPAALATLKKALKKYPTDQELLDASNRVERKRVEAAKLAAIKKLLDRGKWEEALPQLDELRNTALDNATEFARLDAQTRQLRGQTINRPVQPPKPRGLLYGIGAGALVVVAGLTWLILHPKKGVEPPPVDVSPTSLNFAVQPGTQPDAKMITVTGPSHVDTPTTPESWVKVARASASGTTTEFTVLVEPDGLGPGKHDADITFPSLSKSVHVSVTLSSKPGIQLDPPSLTFVLDPNGGTQRKSFAATSTSPIPNPKYDAHWLKVTRNDSGPGKAVFTVEVAARGLSAGTSADLTFPDGVVRVEIAGSQPQPIEIDRRQLTLTADQNGKVAEQKITVTSSSRVSDPTPSAGWVKFRRDNSHGAGKTDFWVYPSPDSLTPGAKLSGDLRFSGDQKVHIDLTVPGYDIEPRPPVSFTATGQSKKLTVTGPSKIPDLKTNVDWLKVTAARTPSPGKAEFTLTIPDGVRPGNYTTVLPFPYGSGVPVSLTVPQSQQQTKPYEISNATLTFTYNRPGAPPAKESFKVTGPADIPEPIKKPAWAQWTRTPGTGDFQVEILPKMLEGAKDNYNDDIVFNFPPEKVVHIHVRVVDAADPLLTSSGTIVWTGILNIGDDLVLKGNNILSAGSGKVMRGVMAPIKIDKDSLEGLELVAEPTQENNFEIHLRNTTGKRFNSLNIKWHK